MCSNLYHTINVILPGNVMCIPFPVCNVNTADLKLQHNIYRLSHLRAVFPSVCLEGPQEPSACLPAPGALRLNTVVINSHHSESGFCVCQPLTANLSA